MTFTHNAITDVLNYIFYAIHQVIIAVAAFLLPFFSPSDFASGFVNPGVECNPNPSIGTFQHSAD